MTTLVLGLLAGSIGVALAVSAFLVQLRSERAAAQFARSVARDVAGLKILMGTSSPARER